MREGERGKGQRKNRGKKITGNKGMRKNEKEAKQGVGNHTEWEELRAEGGKEMERRVK